MTVQVTSMPAKPGFYYGYVIAALGCGVMIMMSGTLYAFGVFLKPVAAEFGWSRAAVSLAQSFCLLWLGVLFLFTGRITDKFGARRVVTVCGIFLGLGFILMSQVHSVWQLYLIYGLLIGTGNGGGLIPMMATITRWFKKKRGLMTGFVIAGVGIGQVIVPPTATKLIELYGWRNCYIITGIAAIIWLVIIAQFFKRDPQQVGRLTDGEIDTKLETTAAVKVSGFTRREAVRTLQVWMLFVIYFVYGFVVQSVMAHIVAHATDIGLTAIAAATIVSMVGVFTVVGRLTVGHTSDKIGHKRALVTSFIVVLFSLLYLQIAATQGAFYLFAVVFGLGYGGMLVIESPMVADLFGLKEHGSILAVVHFGATTGGFFGPALAGKIYDVTESYSLAFWIFALVCLGGMVLSAVLTRPKNAAAYGV